MSEQRSKTEVQSSAVVIFATLLGLGLRLAIVAPAAFPLNDGGLFYGMISDLAANQLRLPAVLSYNSAGIPFAYPPLAFYLYAVLTEMTHIPLLTAMQLGPAIVSAACMPAFFALAVEVMGSRVQAALATLVFALLPRSFDWLIMGGGVSRSLGLLFALLAMWQTLRLFSVGSWRFILPATLLASFVVLTHPEASVYTAISAIVFLVWKGRTTRGVVSALAVGFGTLLLTSPWWGAVLAHHGLSPFEAAAAAARADTTGLPGTVLSFLRLDFADEPFIALLTVLGLVGMAKAAVSRRWLLPAWILVMYLLQPRGAPTYAMIPLAMAVSIGLESVLIRVLVPEGAGAESSDAADESESWEGLLRPVPARLALACVLLFSIASAYAVGWRVKQQLSLGAPDVAAMSWIRENTAPSSRFGLVTEQLPLRDAFSDWFPALTGRVSLGTVFGYEWKSDEDFRRRIDLYQELQACGQRSAECLREWSDRYNAPFDYVLIWNRGGVNDLALSAFLDETAGFEQVYRSPTVVIYAVR